MSSAPTVPTPSQPDQSVLSSVVGNSAPTMPTYDNSEQVETDNLLQGPQNNNPSGGSRLKAILTAVAGAVPAGLAGISDKGRPGFIQGVGEGARAEQNAQNIAQDIKFKTFDDQVRATQLHNQDIELQAHTQAQSDAHQAAQDAQHDWDEAHGLQYDEVPNTGQSAMDWMKAQTSGQGSTSIPAGTHLSADGKTILIPKQNDDTQAAMLQKYKTFQAAYGLPSLPQGAQFVPQKYSDMLQNRLEGHSINGDVYNHDTLPVAIADLQTNRDSLAAKSGTDPAVLKQLDGTISSMKAKLDYLDTHSATVAQQAAQAKAQGTANVTNNPSNQQSAATGAGLKAGAVAAAQAPYQQAKSDASKQTAQQNNGLTANEKLLNDPHTGVIGALAQINQTKASIRAGADGNALLTNMLPTMEVLGINHTAGITRISPAEATAAGTSPDWATRWNAFAQKAATGVLTPEMTAQGNELMDILKQGALTKLYQQQSVLAKGRGIDPASMPSIDSNGNITTFDKVKGSPTGTPSGNTVSLSAARQLAINQGKSDAQIMADIQAHGHQVGQ